MTKLLSQHAHSLLMIFVLTKLCYTLSSGMNLAQRVESLFQYEAFTFIIELCWQSSFRGFLGRLAGDTTFRGSLFQ